MHTTEERYTEEMPRAASFYVSPLPDAGVTDVTGAFQEVDSGMYEAELSLPAGGRAALRFSRVGCRAELEAEDEAGHRVRAEHFGSHTDWGVVLEEFTGCCRVRLVLTPDETLMSPYHPMGMLGSVRLLSLPEAYLTDLYIRSMPGDVPDAFELSFRLHPEGADRVCRVEMALDDGTSETLPAPGAGEIRAEIHPAMPHRWSCADPFLYTIQLRLKDQDGRTIAQYTRRAGLVSIRREGQRLLLNGEPLKLYGLTYREPLPREGFSPAEDLRLFQEAHVNFLRSLYAPFSEDFLNLCDEAGILVEQTAPVFGLGNTLPARQNSPALRPFFDQMYREMALRDRSHPCLLLWSLGDECVWGDVFRRGRAILRELDPGRLITFHLPMTIPQEEWPPDVWSVQHSAWNLTADVPYDQMVIFHAQGAENEIGYATARAEGVRVPVLHEAFALIPSYDLEDLDRDPGVHEFWGESLRRFVRRFRETEGALGGAVMAAVDEDGREFPSLAGLRWGVLDVHHRPKPEYFHLQMAYGEAQTVFQVEKGSVWRLTAGALSALLNPETGRFTEIALGERPLIVGGPYLHMGRYPLGPWRLASLAAEPRAEGIQVIAEGEYERSATVRYTTLLRADGTLHTACELLSLARPMPHRVKAGIGLDPGGLTEFGLSWRLPGSVTACDFVRQGRWKEYPADHIGRLRGTALRTHPEDFRAQKFHVLTADVVMAEGRVEILPRGDTHLRLEEVPEARCLVPAEGEGGEFCSLTMHGDWYAVGDDAGGIGSTEIMAKDGVCALDIAFEGSGIVLRGATDRIRGLCDIELDGDIVAEGISQHTPAAYFPSMSRGYEKRYHQVLFAAEDLSFGTHTLRLRVRGERETAAQDAWIGVESVEILRPDCPRQVMMHVNQAVNYPRMVYGNYMNPPILVGPGERAECRLVLVAGMDDREEDASC